MKRYVVGDVHGSHRELVQLIDLIYKDAGDEEFRIIFVGDYVDRGPNSRGVVKLVQGLQAKGHFAIRGNHEEMLLMGEYLYAQETLISYGGHIPEEDSFWMQMLPKYYEDDTIIVAHAAVQPNVPMEAQKDEWLMWVRYDRNRPANLENGKHLYHGHTPFIAKIPEGAIDRTNVDTGCVFGGYLTAAVVGEDGKPTHFLQVAHEDSRIDF